MYQSDAPLAERRASVLSLDSELLRNLLGQVDPGELLDPQVIRQVEEELQRLAPGRRAKGEEGLFDLLRELGPMTVEDLVQRHTGSSEEIAVVSGKSSCSKTNLPDDDSAGRSVLPVWMPPGCAMPSAYGYQSHCQRFICTESVTRFATSFLRYLRAHALVTSEQLAHEFSLGIAIVEEQLQQLREQGLVMNLQQDIWVSGEVFRRLRLRSLQAASQDTMRSKPASPVRSSTPSNLRLFISLHVIIVRHLPFQL